MTKKKTTRLKGQKQHKANNVTKRTENMTKWTNTIKKLPNKKSTNYKDKRNK